MKIFDWVHRKFNHKYEANQDVRKADLNEIIRKDKIALLETESLDNVFDGWKEGLFVIATFGFDPERSKDYEIEHDTYLCHDDISHKNLVFVGECECDQDTEMEVPLVLKAAKHGFVHDQKTDHLKYEKSTEPNDDEAKKEKKVGERITLADLLWADSENNLLKKKKLAYDQDHVKVEYNSTDKSNMKHESNDDNVSLISNKKLEKDHTARPLKIMNRMMRKMLKKKIHPDIVNQKETTRTKSVCIRGSVKNS
ncbi:protein TILLER ANGLE CONTROL 1-like [Rutidosis leptorrhynchoides]|uniref:protein TILLER ANGLE CONTROL 1-like n=1 Tax=Rutidosis leptorrhynchoides TaxID=125765 RepID=UPI003A9A5EA9